MFNLLFYKYAFYLKKVILKIKVKQEYIIKVQEYIIFFLLDLNKDMLFIILKIISNFEITNNLN